MKTQMRKNKLVKNWSGGTKKHDKKIDSLVDGEQWKHKEPQDKTYIKGAWRGQSGDREGWRQQWKNKVCARDRERRKEDVTIKKQLCSCKNTYIILIEERDTDRELFNPAQWCFPLKRGWHLSSTILKDLRTLVTDNTVYFTERDPFKDI